MTVLLDVNVLIALLAPEHVHHDAAESWFAATDTVFATCPSTQGSLVRYLVRAGQSANTAHAFVTMVVENAKHEFWPDDVSYQHVPLNGVIGHRQITDSYLAQLARTHEGRLATFDKGLASLHTDVAELVPTA